MYFVFVLWNIMQRDQRYKLISITHIETCKTKMSLCDICCAAMHSSSEPLRNQTRWLTAFLLTTLQNLSTHPQVLCKNLLWENRLFLQCLTRQSNVANKFTSGRHAWGEKRLGESKYTVCQSILSPFWVPYYFCIWVTTLSEKTCLMICYRFSIAFHRIMYVRLVSNKSTVLLIYSACVM